MRATIRRRLFGVALASALAGLANLCALATLMLVHSHDAVLIAILLVYSLGVGAGTALALARPSARAVEDAVEAQRRDLITAVSHDLRTPLASLRAMIEAIDDGVVDDPATVRLYTAEMRLSAGALGDLVDDLFELLGDPGIIRHRGKIEATIANAAATEAIHGGARRSMRSFGASRRRATAQARRRAARISLRSRRNRLLLRRSSSASASVSSGRRRPIP